MLMLVTKLTVGYVAAIVAIIVYWHSYKYHQYAHFTVRHVEPCNLRRESVVI